MNSMKSCLALAMVISGATLSGPAAAAQEAPARPAPPMPSGPVEVNGIAAKVNGRLVTKNQVSMLLGPIYGQLVAQYPRRGPQFDKEFKKAKDKVIQELIDRQIILDEFKQLGAFIKPHLIDEEIKRQIRDDYNGDEAKLRELLKLSRLTMEGYREMTREKMVVSAMRAQQFSDAPPPLPNEIQKEYDEIKPSLRDVTKDVLTFQKIFIPAADPSNPGSTPDTQLILAEDIARQLSEGKDFATLAKAHSKDAYAEDGGLQKDIARTDLSPEFAAIIVDAPVGKIVGPLLDRTGFTIIKTIKIDFGPAPALDDKVRESIEERVRRKKTSQQYERWIEGKRKRAMIKIMD
ncbi:SurA N-terminal domain-containing protein [Luteolibacter yonseiensis]|uniref:SurA N-terminal domain-containing protein n=1 Tax=Luteolibacter yonseiensis TaxID=1144680 RepID=A0A934VB45_9BACT|nr:peptidylprolyl isomerase [Luteolibacter yonseiensis]MBK1815780.1 SurA N-terminal domain-containing protein [Luteolibacter yonseiensis]